MLLSGRGSAFSVGRGPLSVCSTKPRCASSHVTTRISTYTRQAKRTVLSRAEGSQGGIDVVSAAAAEELEPEDTEPEVTFMETSGSDAELAISILLGFTILYAPLTIASIGERAWFKTTITNKRLIIDNTSPLFKNKVQIPFGKIKEIRSAPVAFGLWGNMVVFLKDGSRLEMTGVPKFEEVRSYIEERIRDLEANKSKKKLESLLGGAAQ